MDVPAPVYAGDTVSAEFQATEKRSPSSREDAGLVVIDATMTDRDDGRCSPGARSSPSNAATGTRDARLRSAVRTPP